ncbi:MAG: MEKHLA domain-containing protein [Rubripirellula sp.]
MPAWEDNDWTQRSQFMLDSYARWVGAELMDRGGTQEEQAQRLFELPFVVVAHGVEEDPLLSYANATALKLWKITIADLLRTPSRKTAEPVHRDERARLLERTTRDGFVDDYRGVRIATDGQRFLIDRATVWNVLDTDGQRVGQAATFQDWTMLEPGCDVP